MPNCQALAGGFRFVLRKRNGGQVRRPYSISWCKDSESSCPFFWAAVLMSSASSSAAGTFEGGQATPQPAATN
jgi:hypothetical protein